MKIRTGFVSNSSSSSFICQVTNEVYSGYDSSIDDFGLVKCENGHLFHEDHLVDFDMFSDERKLEIAAKFDVQTKIYDYKTKNKIAWNFSIPVEVKEDFEKDVKVIFDNMTEYEKDKAIEDISDYDCREDVPACACPICTFGFIQPKLLIKYMHKKFGTSENEIKKEIKSKFSSFEEFTEFVDKG